MRTNPFKPKKIKFDIHSGYIRFCELFVHEAINKQLYIKAKYMIENRLFFINIASGSGSKYRIDRLRITFTKNSTYEKNYFPQLNADQLIPMLAQDETNFHFGLKAAPSFCLA